MKVGVGIAMFFSSRKWNLYRSCQEAIRIRTIAMPNLLICCLGIQTMPFAFPLVWVNLRVILSRQCKCSAC